MSKANSYQVPWDSTGSHGHSLTVLRGVLAAALHYCRDPEVSPGKLAPQLAVEWTHGN